MPDWSELGILDRVAWVPMLGALIQKDPVWGKIDGRAK